ncbi:MAG: YihA family ribosome biogenesis GTP-binding protein [Cyclobacteriaceae bacterium]|nr:YihA family ribosome biogenesis GTP-binding protein [Cyclobacteriaceae bacterium]
MIIKSAEFIMSNTDPGRSPVSNKHEFAFIGRSNVGKSSLINMLVNRKTLANTSSTPGKTQTINHFLINEKWYLVDLPGYGYAHTARSKLQSWGPMIETYLKKRETLTTTFVLLDPRHEPQKIDLEFIEWMASQNLPFSLVFTKSDKLKRSELLISIKRWEDTLKVTWAELPPMFLTSSEKHEGKDQLLGYIGSLLTGVKK